MPSKWASGPIVCIFRRHSSMCHFVICVWSICCFRWSDCLASFGAVTRAIGEYQKIPSKGQLFGKIRFVFCEPSDRKTLTTSYWDYSCTRYSE